MKEKIIEIAKLLNSLDIDTFYVKNNSGFAKKLNEYIEESFKTASSQCEIPQHEPNRLKTFTTYGIKFIYIS